MDTASCRSGNCGAGQDKELQLAKRQNKAGARLLFCTRSQNRQPVGEQFCETGETRWAGAYLSALHLAVSVCQAAFAPHRMSEAVEVSLVQTLQALPGHKRFF